MIEKEKDRIRNEMRRSLVKDGASYAEKTEAYDRWLKGKIAEYDLLDKKKRKSFESFFAYFGHISILDEIYEMFHFSLRGKLYLLIWYFLVIYCIVLPVQLKLFGTAEESFMNEKRYGEAVEAFYENENIEYSFVNALRRNNVLNKYYKNAHKEIMEYNKQGDKASAKAVIEEAKGFLPKPDYEELEKYYNKCFTD